MDVFSLSVFSFVSTSTDHTPTMELDVGNTCTKTFLSSFDITLACQPSDGKLSSDSDTIGIIISVPCEYDGVLASLTVNTRQIASLVSLYSRLKLRPSLNGRPRLTTNVGVSDFTNSYLSV